MKDRLKSLNTLVDSNILDLKDFYTLDMRNDEIKVQGHMSSDRIEKYRKLGFDFVLHDDLPYLVATKYDLTITLT